jgi:kynurenine 3-monooxygenase
MMIALPNLDGTFTCTLFFPFEGEVSFNSLKTREQVQAFLSKKQNWDHNIQLKMKQQ